MEAFVECLRADHRRLMRVLVQLDRDIQECRKGSGPAAEILVPIVNALHYIRGYPEHWHHPLEDFLYQRLLELDAPCARSVELLLDEHNSMERQTSSLVQRFEHAIESGENIDKLLLDDCYAYFERQVAHQKRENESVFPLMTAFLDARDWRAAENTLLATPSDTTLRRHYQHLYHRTVNREPDIDRRGQEG